MYKGNVKRVAAIHDLSGFGRTSLSVVIPVISSLGIQVCSLPTAVLSSHTGGFSGYSFVDLTDSMEKFIGHWKEMNLKFDAVYSGFLGSPRQADIVSDFIDHFTEDNNLIVIDPVMGDNGMLYPTMTDEMVDKMRRLISRADIITPNYTEAGFLLGEEVSECPDDGTMKTWLKRLSEAGPRVVIITSVPSRDDSQNTNVLAYNKRDGRFWKVACKYIPTHFPGTGDIFTSVLTGSILQGDSLPVAMDRAVGFITSAIRASYGFDYPEREGVLLEKVLDSLKLPVMSNSYELF